MASQAHSEPNRANPPIDSQKKKKKKKKTNTESEIKLTHGTHGHVAVEKTNPQYTDTVYTIQSKSKTNQKQYCVYQKKKKKKKPNTEPFYQNGKTKPKNPNTHSSVAVTRSSSP